MREKKTLAWASVSHFFIDFLCAWLITHQLIENGSWFFLLFLYNFLAFAAQLPLGILLDALCAQRMAGRAGAMGRLLQDNARLITAGTGCLFCGAALLPGIGHLPLVLLCGAGNAMFHVGTGSDLLEKSEGKAWPSGLFVSTGAVGIFAMYSYPPVCPSLSCVQKMSRHGYAREFCRACRGAPTGQRRADRGIFSSCCMPCPCCCAPFF